MTWDKKVPFNKKTGNHCRFDVHLSRFNINDYEYKNVSSFNATLKIISTRTLLDENTKMKYIMLPSDWRNMIMTAVINHGIVEGTWKFRKYGGQYGLQYIGGKG